MTPWVDDPTTGTQFWVPDPGEAAPPGSMGGGGGYQGDENWDDVPVWQGPPGGQVTPPVVVTPIPGVGIGAGGAPGGYVIGAKQYDPETGWSTWNGTSWVRDSGIPRIGGGGINAVNPNQPTKPAPLPGGAGGHGVSTGSRGLPGVGGRLTIAPVGDFTELEILNALRYQRGALGMSLDQFREQLNNPSFMESIANSLGIDVGLVQNVSQKVLSTGISGLLMALTGNFPLAAMGYFASDRVMDKPQMPFQGWMAGAAVADGQLVLPIGMPIPEGLPNEIFNDWRFICYDRLSQKWWPTDEIQPLSYQGSANEYRWLCMDRVDGKMYHANWIRKPRIYI